MKETTAFFRDVAVRHSELATRVRDPMLVTDLLQLAHECDAKADALEKQLREHKQWRPNS